MSKLWSYIAAFGLFIASVITFGAYNQRIAKTSQKLKEIQKSLKQHEYRDEFNEIAKDIEAENSRISDKQLFDGLRKYAKKK